MTAFTPFDFSIRQLQYAVAVADEGSFGRAATACGVSQPSLSAQVARLEEALGVTLFERHARGVQITRCGDALLPRMRQAIDAATGVGAAAAALVDPYAVTLGIGVIPTIAPYLLPRVVEQLRQRERRPRVYWRELQTAACEEALAAGELDAMITADPPTRASIDHVDLGWEPFWVVAPTDIELPTPVTVSDLSEQEILLLDDGHCLRDQTMTLCMRPGARESPWRATSLPTMVQMVASGMGVTVLPASALPLEARHPGLRALPFAESGVGRMVRFAWRSRTPHARVMRELAGIIRAALTDAVEEGVDFGTR